MKVITDDIGNAFLFEHPPCRVLSLCPSFTETLCDLGLESKLAGVTDYCVHPVEKLARIARVGGPKTLNITKIAQLRPDIIIASKEENAKEQVESLMKNHRVFVFDIESFEQGLDLILTLGKIFNAIPRAMEVINKISSAFSEIPIIENRRVIYLIWRHPWMAAGKNSFIDSMLSKLGFKNQISSTHFRYPEIDLKGVETDLILLPSEPYEFKDKDKEYIESLQIAKKVVFVDGEMFCWYGTHMLKAAKYFKKFLLGLE